MILFPTLFSMPMVTFSLDLSKLQLSEFPFRQSSSYPSLPCLYLILLLLKYNLWKLLFSNQNKISLSKRTMFRSGFFLSQLLSTVSRTSQLDSVLILMTEGNAKIFTELSWMYFTSFPAAMQHVPENHFLALEVVLGRGMTLEPHVVNQFPNISYYTQQFCVEVEQRIEEKTQFIKIIGFGLILVNSYFFNYYDSETILSLVILQSSLCKIMQKN